jgi:3-hydroxyisobutyrate dehydrogenase
MAETIGFVGVGRMGGNMARRLHESGFPVTVVHDVRAKVAAGLADELGCEATKSLARVTERAQVILTVVSNDIALDEIYNPKSKSLLHKAQGRLFINCATVTPRLQVEVESRVLRAGGQCLEACLASSVRQAREGSLYMMCAGESASFERAKPILAKLSATLRYLGRSGEAAKLKAVVNMVMNINTAGLAEGLALGDALGLDLCTLRAVLGETGAASRVLETDGDDMLKRDHTCHFSAAHAAKDSTIALTLSRQQRLHLPLATATKKQYDRLVKFGLGESDKSAIAELTFRDRGPTRR